MGRVQTPTLAMVVERELAIRGFVPEDYRVVATFSPRAGDGTKARGSGRRRPPDAARSCRPTEAKRPDRRARAHRRGAHRIEAQTKRSAAAALRPDGTAAPRQPALRLQRAEDAGSRAGAL